VTSPRALELEDEQAGLRARLRDVEQELATHIARFDPAASDESAPGRLVTALAAGSERLSRRLLREVFDGARDAMVLADDDGAFVDANHAACAMFAMARADLLGKSLADLGAPPGEGAEVWRQLRGAACVAAVRVVGADRTQRELELRSRIDVIPGLHLVLLLDTTGRREALETARRTEELFGAAFRMSPLAMSVTTAAEERYVDVNDALVELAGRPRDALIGHTASDLAFWDDASHRERLIAAMKDGSRVRDFRTQLRRADGVVRNIVLSAQRVLIGGEPCVLNVLLDDTERLRAETVLRENRWALEEAQAVAHVGSWVHDLGAGDALVWSTECHRIFGVPLDAKLTFATFTDRLHPSDRARVLDEIATSVARREAYALEYRIVRDGGEARCIQVQARLDCAPDGRPLRRIGTVHDITDRRAMLDKLERSERRYRRIVEGTSEGIVTIDADGKISFANGRLAEMLGVSRGDLVGARATDFINTAHHVSHGRHLAARSAGNAGDYETALACRGGPDVWVNVAATPLFDETGAFEASLGFITDIGARRRAEEERNRLASIVENSADAILSTSVDGVVTSWNAGAERLLGFTAHEAVGMPVSILIPADGEDDERTLALLAAGGNVEPHETVRLRKGGAPVHVELTVSPIRNAAGEVIGASKIIRDLTERHKTEAALRRTEEQLRQAQKMEAIGALAGGVAHDFNNVLSVILTYTGLLLEDMPAGDPLRADIEDIEKAGTRASELTGQLLAFSRQQVLEPRVVDLNHVVGEVRRLLQRALREDIELSLVLAPSLGTVFVDPGQIEQIVMNLAVNARDAMPSGGKLAIETASVVLDAAYCATHHGVTPGPFVMLRVTDTGSGIDAATRARIFEPFFTTKAKGKGTGLGLAIVFGIVHQSGGHIDVHSEVNRGTTFTIYLPRCDLPAPESPSLRPGARAIGGNETVLVVEDDDQVRRTTSAILVRYGYDILDAASGADALRICAERRAPIHLLVTDVVMPHMNGRELAEHVVKLRPEMAVLFVSGYAEHSIIHHGVLDAGLHYLQKPITPELLARKVRDVIDATRNAVPGAEATRA
jgi:two-component system cell cycle sensor histidine kinase/response regulator CckA